MLIYFTSRWTVFSATALNNNALNSRPLIAQLRIKRGRILADDGTVLAKSVKAGHGTWSRTYPQGSLFSQAVGYSSRRPATPPGWRSPRRSTCAAARVRSPACSVLRRRPPRSATTSTRRLTRARRRPRAEALAGQAGSVVALNPRTGAVLTMYSNPTYDNNHPHARQGSASRSAVWSTARPSAYPPGSTFKIVTATAAIDTGKYTPNSIVNGNSPVTVSGVPLANDGNQSFGEITLTTALTYSVNTVWAPVAENVGTRDDDRIHEAVRLLLDAAVGLPGERDAREPRPISRRPGAIRPARQDEDIGRIGIGQGGLLVTPLQMAMVAAAVANNGRLMVPHLVSSVIAPDGRTVTTIAPRLYHQVMSAKTAQEVNLMMRTVVDEGTGTPAQLGNGIEFAGKTGTASVGPAGLGETQPWFIGFAPANDPKVAVAVDLERSDSGQSGGEVAGADRPRRRPDAAVGGEVVLYGPADSRAAVGRG